MKITYNPDKSLTNIGKHGVRLERAKDMAIHSVYEDTRKNYKEHRYIALGDIDSRLHILVFTHRASSIRAISLKKANKREVARYEQTLN